MGEIVRRKKVLLISPDFGYGGAEKSMAKLSIVLEKDYDVHFAVFNKDVQVTYPFKGRLHSLDVSAGTNLLHKLWSFYLRVTRLRQLKKSLVIDVSISALEGADYVNVLSSIGEKLVLNIRGSKQHDPNIRGVSGFFRHKLLIPWVYNQADRLVVVNRGIGEELKHCYRLKSNAVVRPIANYYDIEELEAAAQQPIGHWESFFSANKVLVAVGRLSAEKGFERLIDVFANLKQRLTGVKLFLIGSGNQLESLSRRIAANGLSVTADMANPEFSADVVLAGYQANPHKFVARSTLFVSSSFTEGFPNAMVEAMCLGIPVVASDCPYGPAEILDGNGTSSGKYGALLPVLSPGDQVIAMWRSTLETVILDSTRLTALGHLARRRAREFNFDRFLSEWKHTIDF